MSAPAVRRLGAPAVKIIGPPANVRKIDASSVRRLGARAVIARDEVGGRAFNDEKVVIINDDDKCICVSVGC